MNFPMISWWWWYILEGWCQRQEIGVKKERYGFRSILCTPFDFLKRFFLFIIFSRKKKWMNKKWNKSRRVWAISHTFSVARYTLPNNNFFHSLVFWKPAEQNLKSATFAIYNIPITVLREIFVHVFGLKKSNLFL